MPRKPRDRGYYDLYRGVSLDSSAPGMERIRGILHPYLIDPDDEDFKDSHDHPELCGPCNEAYRSSL